MLYAPPPRHRSRVVLLAMLLLLGYGGVVVVNTYAARGGHLALALGSRTLLIGQPAPVVAAAEVVTQPVTAIDTAGDLTQLSHAPSMTAAQIDAVLASYGSPAAGEGQTFMDLGAQYGINPAIALAFFVHESSAGTAGAAVTTHSVGNIICAGYATCDGRWRTYANWHDSINDWYKLIRVEYMDGRGLTTINQVIPIYAPAVENDVQGYINAVNSMVQQWSAPPVAATKANVTRTMQISTGFDATGDVWCSVGQLGCKHWGIDYGGAAGDPVFAPFALTVYAVGCYPPGPTEGCYIQGTLADGDVLYLGHLASLPPFQAGEHVAAGTQVGVMNGMNHTHAQLAPAGNYGPCASDGSCLNFDDYWKTH